jgi:hypothetical protein
MVGPLVGGMMLDAGFEFGRVYLLVGLTMLVSAVFIQFLRVSGKAKDAAAPVH